MTAKKASFYLQILYFALQPVKCSIIELMANFEAAMIVLLRHEGGFSSNPADLGGPTNMGITQGDLAHWYNRPVSIDEIKLLDIETVKKYYRIRFWEQLKLDSLSSTKLATILFDQGVLRGAGRIVQDVQHLLNLDPDGIMGPDTIEKLNVQPELSFGIKLLGQCQLSYCYLVQAKPTQVEFLSGWISRTQSLLDYLLFSV
jgi:lysozyme family protein